MPSSKDPVINRQKAKEYRLAHPDWHRKANREWVAKKRQDPAFVAKQREAARLQRRKWTPEMKAERAAYQKEWFARHEDYNQRKQAEKYASYPVRAMVYAAKTRAARLGVPFDLDWRLIEFPEVCPVLGVPMRQTKGGGSGRESPSLDRLIPALGYVQSNVRVISAEANIIKNNKTLDEMRAYAVRLRRQLEGADAVVAYLERELA